MTTPRWVMVRYTVEPGLEEINETLVRTVFDELAGARPRDLRYATFKDSDGLTFVHLACIETDDGHSPLADLDSFRAFQAAIHSRCTDGPSIDALEPVGSYRLFDGEDETHATTTYAPRATSTPHDGSTTTAKELIHDAQHDAR